MEEIDKDLLEELEALGERPPAIAAGETLPAMVESFSDSLAWAKNILIKFEAEANALRNAVLSLTIKDHLGSAKMGEFKATAQKITKKIDARIKEMTQEATDYVQAVRNFGANLKAPLVEVKAEADRKISVWAQYVRVEREKQEKAAQEAMAKEQAKLNKTAARAGIEPVVLAEIKLPPTRTVIRTDTGTTFEVRKWKGQIVDYNMVDRRFCSPDPRKIQEAIDGGTRNPDMAGVDIFEDVRMVTRTK